MDSLTVTILTIITATFLSAFIKGRKKDRCLKKVNDYFVHIYNSKKCTIWGRAEIESNSIVINFRPKINKSFKIKNIKNLEKVTNVLFSSKRKMINKNIRKILKDNQIKNIKNFNINSRPSEIKPEIYYKITEMVEEN